MKKLFAGLAFVLCSFPAVAQTPEDTQFDYTIENSKPCGRTRNGVYIRAYKTPCPDLKWVGKLERRFLRRMSASKHLLKGTTTVFTGVPLLTFPSANTRSVYGIAPNKKFIVVLDDIEVWDSHGHELGHLAFYQIKLDPTLIHYGLNDCPNEFWSDWEACELLDAATAWYTDQPMLDKKSRFRKAFEATKKKRKKK